MEPPPPHPSSHSLKGLLQRFVFIWFAFLSNQVIFGPFVILLPSLDTP